MRLASSPLAAAVVFAGLTAMLPTLPAQAGDAARGEALYRVYCTQCHGLTGRGDGVNAATLAVKPRNHTDRTEMSARSDDDLFKAVKHGGQAVNKSILMPNWDGNLSDAEIEDVVTYLRELCCQAAQ